jgi:hypothetical protein
MSRTRPRSEIVYVERSGDASAKWLFWGALLGAGLALLYAPRSGEETRRLVQRRLWKLRAMTEEKLDEFTQQLGGRGRREEPHEDEADELDPESYGNGPGRTSGGTARQDLERRLTEARSRRRAAAADIEEPLA